MKIFKLSSLALAFLIVIAACKTSKKTKNSGAAGSPTATTKTAATETATAGPMLPARSKSGVNPPGAEELAAIQVKYKDVTMEKLSEGHSIYTGVCTGCHGTKSIYTRAEEKWQDIINDMAERAKITDAQKDAVYKYVLAVKATQPK